MLFTEAKSKKELQREAEAKAAAALAKVAGEKNKEPDKRDILCYYINSLRSEHSSRR